MASKVWYHEFIYAIYDLALVLKPLCEQRSFSCHKSHKQAYYIFQFSFFQVKIINRYEDQIIFFDTQHLLQENIL